MLKGRCANLNIEQTTVASKSTVHLSVPLNSTLADIPTATITTSDSYRDSTMLWRKVVYVECIPVLGRDRACVAQISSELNEREP